MTTPQPGQIYRSADPREAGQRIRVLSVTGDHATIESVTGPARRRTLLTSALHSTATTATGAPRRTGYVLAGAQATPVRDDTRPAAPDHLGLHTTPDGSLWAPLSDRPPHPPMLQRIRDEHGHACGRISAEQHFVEEHFGPLTPIAVVPAAALAWDYGTVTRTRDHVEIQLAAPAPPLRLTTDQAQVLGDQLLDTADGERGIPDDAPAPAAGLDLDAIRARHATAMATPTINMHVTTRDAADGIRAVAGLLADVPPLLAAVEQRNAEIAQLRAALAETTTGRDQAEDLLRVAHETSNRSEAARTAAVADAGRLRARVAELETALAESQTTRAEILGDLSAIARQRDKFHKRLGTLARERRTLADANAALGREARIVRTWTDGVERRNSQLRGELRTALARAAELETARRHLDHFDIHHNSGPRLPLPARGWAWWCHTCGDAALGLPDRATAEAHAIDHHEAMHAAAPAPTAAQQP